MLMLEETKTLMRRWFEEVWNKGRAEVIEEILHPDVVAHGLLDENGNTVRGVEGFQAFHRRFMEAFPDIEIVIEDMVAEGNKVAALCTVRGHHTGDGLGIAASQKPVQFSGITLAHIEEGKI